MQRINYAGSDKTELTIEPTYTISVTQKTMDESETANAILQSASDQILSLIHISVSNGRPRQIVV